MGANVNITLYGVKEALKEIKKIDPIYRKELNKRAKQIAKPVTDTAKQHYPEKILSGMKRNWKGIFPYNQAAARRGVKIITSTATKNTSVIAIVQMDRAAAVFDVAGRRDMLNPLAKQMTKKTGWPASRIMWPAYELHAAAVLEGYKELVADIMKEVNRKVVEG